ncbi:MAG TPA: glycosyltransferase family 2 protein [Chloroflexi bacterium]|jgi:glycosyltransferase involved in cell wall biosynthesis|nr:glycosyltransferase family 2 protein [Chloroflexota bacterium]
MPSNEIVVSVVIPTYNEEEAIGVVLDDVTRACETLECGWEILVINDGSTDRTCAICETYPHVRIVSHRRNLGNGAARTTGIKSAKGQYVVMIDADATYPADEIPRLVKELESCDMVIGAREREMGTLKWLRSAAKEFIRALASYLTETRIPDLNSGLRAMKRDLVPQFFGILPTTHSWVSTITMAFLSSGYEVRWVPIAYYKRIGRSTFDPIGDTYNYISLVIRTMMYFNPLRMFLPVIMALFAVGVGKMIYDIFTYNFHFAPSTVILMLTVFQLTAVGLLADLIVRRTKG